MNTSEKLNEAYQKFDAANNEDPNIEEYEGKKYPKELLYAQRMTEVLTAFDPNASDALKLTVRCQHLKRWEIPRESYEMNRVGYLQWRQELKKYHAKKAAEILTEIGYDEATINRVQFLLLKKQLKRDAETQTLEDVICLVFLKFYFEPFIQKHDDAKLIAILQKTWKKMSPKGHEEALKLSFSDKGLQLIQDALA